MRRCLRRLVESTIRSRNVNYTHKAGSQARLQVLHEDGKMGHLSNQCGAVPGGLSSKKKKQNYKNKMPGGSSFPSQNTRIFVDLGGDSIV